MAGSTILQMIYGAPLNSFIIALNSVIWFIMWNTRRGFEDVATSFRHVVLERQYYRVVTATFCHLNVLHIVFNMASLYSIGMLETAMGTYWYLRQTVLLIFVSHVAWMVITFLLVRFGGAATARMVDSSAVGYSGVLFGWLALQSVLLPGSSMSFIGIPVPAWLAPWAALLITQLIMPRASFMGHLSGIVAGYVIGFKAFNWVSEYWFWSTVVLLCLVMLLSLKANVNTGRLLACITVSPAFMAATGLGATASEIAAAAEAGGGAGSSGSAGAPRRYLDGGILRVVDRGVASADSMTSPGDIEMANVASPPSVSPSSSAASASGAGARPVPSAPPAAGATAPTTSSSASSSSSSVSRGGAGLGERLRGVWSSVTGGLTGPRAGGYGPVGANASSSSGTGASQSSAGSAPPSAFDDDEEETSRLTRPSPGQ